MIAACVLSVVLYCVAACFHKHMKTLLHYGGSFTVTYFIHTALAFDAVTALVKTPCRIQPHLRSHGVTDTGEQESSHAFSAYDNV